MSELLQNANQRKELLKHMILELHHGRAPEEVRPQIVRLLGKIPYSEVVEVEQQLMAEGLPQEEVLQLCDLHARALEGQIESPKDMDLPPGHPVDTFKRENEALLWEVKNARALIERAGSGSRNKGGDNTMGDLLACFFRLLDVDKHYKKKENLLFPHLERYGITGPSTVMWGKDDETREKLKNAISALEDRQKAKLANIGEISDSLLEPALLAIQDMIAKEEEILFPMSMEKLTDTDWYGIYEQSPEIGYCLFSPSSEWKPDLTEKAGVEERPKGKIHLPSGSFTEDELTAVLNTIPFDITFVDKDDEVRYFSEGRERIFDRNRAIIGRNVKHCHPPKSLHVVERIMDDFKRGTRDSAAFWLNLNDRFIHIEYLALRDEDGRYLGILEVSQDLTAKRALEGERRLLSYD